MSPPPPPMRRQCAGSRQRSRHLACLGREYAHAPPWPGRGQHWFRRSRPAAMPSLPLVSSERVISVRVKFRDCLKWRSLNLFQTRWKHPFPTSRTSAGFATNLALGQGCSNAADGGNRDERLISAARPSGLLADTQKPILHPAPWGLHSLLLLPENGAE